MDVKAVKREMEETKKEIEKIELEIKKYKDLIEKRLSEDEMNVVNVGVLEKRFNDKLVKQLDIGDLNRKIRFAQYRIKGLKDNLSDYEMLLVNLRC